MFKKYLQNARKPQGFGGRLFIAAMNIGHTPISLWGLKLLDIKKSDIILDIGCGGGKNIERMLKRACDGKVCGLDYWQLCVETTKKLNRKAVCAGHADIRLGSASENPWADNSFDIVTAFETVYFWPDFAKDICEVRRVLKPKGIFFICNEMNKPEEGKTPYQFWVKTLDLKTYTASDFTKYLTQAGFGDIKIAAKGKNGICITAAANKNGEKTYA